MKISVVTVSFNAAPTIRHMLQSFVDQDYSHKQLVVIDGGSTDGTPDIVRTLAGPHVRLVSEPDGGIYEAMNKGLACHDGDAVGFLNADDRFKDSSVLSRIAAGLAEADVVFGDLEFVRDHEQAEVVRAWRGSPWRKGAFRRGWMPAHPTFYMRRHVAEAVGGFDTDLRIAADYDHMLRVLELGGFTSRYIPEVLVQMMEGGASTRSVGSYLRGNLESLRSRRRWLGAGFVDRALIAKPLGKIGQFLGRGVASHARSDAPTGQESR